MAGGPIYPSSAYPADSSGRLFPTFYSGTGGNASPVDEGLGVKASLDASNNGVEGGYVHGFSPTNQLALTTNPGLPEMMQAIVLQNTAVSQAVDDETKRMNSAIAQARR